VLSPFVVKALNAQPPLRVWSVIVTVFGDIVMDEGRNTSPAPLATAAIISLLNSIGIDAAQTRTALSRLVANTTLERQRLGRASSHSLTASATLAFKTASELIYGRSIPQPDGRFRMVLTDGVKNRVDARQTLLEAGFRMIGTTSAIKPHHANALAVSLPDGTMQGLFLPDAASLADLARLFETDALGSSYAAFTAAFTPLLGMEPASPEDAFVSRICLVHQFRRLVLKDPFLPDSLLPRGWRGPDARDVFQQLLAKLRGPAAKHVGSILAKTKT
jgi:phenylacetic acid degradation operon negative regulatory protein